ncbi:hypothetical protein LTS08_002507 [Lithohypha guttulata]|uniref:DUF1857-domain-containing protein n=1 Tax=Lithohypha guttulata TaxID=1690604 RepID=A0AAN7TCG0_9EURO|nr:hypothetical protein LTR51_001677 [Lithohypha guttulata]KAK5090584.1 hypothetical protein LTR05_000758 [Lithohypha guttulata]KAK5104616.1 hypothetical protein LTS08_002507 [Lithohypha guttulata]
MSHPAAYLAYTAPINPDGATPVLSKDQVWQGLQRKVRQAQVFVPNAIKSTQVLSEEKDEHGREVVKREVIFIENDRKARESCVFFPQMKVEAHKFIQSDGTKVLNTISDGAGGQLYMTYQFEWFMAEDTPVEKQQENIKKWEAMSKTAVESSIDKIRELVVGGKL